MQTLNWIEQQGQKVRSLELFWWSTELGNIYRILIIMMILQILWITLNLWFFIISYSTDQ